MTTRRGLVHLAASLLLAQLLGALAALPPGAGSAEAQEPARPDAGERAEGQKEGAGWIPEDSLSVTHHEVTVDGRTLSYTATAGYLPLREELGKIKARVFFIAYTLDGVDDPSSRPITFTFNGGPGSSSVWLHLGGLGPRRVRMGPEGEAPSPPYDLVPNDGTWLDLTDLVFIDPVTTGFSRAVPDESDDQFHGLREDVESVGQFIRLYATRYSRWNSPKFLAGESYGTTRAAGLAGHLQDRYGMYLNGVVLVSSILNFGTARFDPGNDLPYVLFLPTYTATAWYHQKLPADLQARGLEELLEEVREWAIGGYTLALARGDGLERAAREEVATRLARYTGLSVDYVEANDLRVPIFRFVKELRREDGLTVGRLDSRFTGRDRDDAGEGFDFDPSYAAIYGPFTALLNDYVRRDLEFESDLPYEILTGRVRPWSYASAQNRYVNVAETLRGAMHENEFLRVHVANGYYDLATPFFATEHTFSHMGLDPALRDHITMSYYESGHMMYIREADLGALKDAARAFYAEAVP